MTAIVTSEQWRASRTALKEAGDRFADLVAAIPNPHETMATADWSVAVTAAHVATVAWLDASIVDTGRPPAAVPGLDAQVLTTTVDTVDTLNDWVLERFVERDTGVLAARLRADIDHILRSCEGRDPSDQVSWLGGAQASLGGLLAHLVNELLIHGHDIARAAGLRWVVPPRAAALFFELFVGGMIRNGYGVLLDGEPPDNRRVAVEFRSRYTAPMTLVLERGVVSVEEPGGAADVRVFFDPAVLNLMMFGRMSRLRAVLTGKVVIRGRRPWLLPVFLRTLRVPDKGRTARQPLTRPA